MSTTTSSHGMTDAELASLTAEEREGLLEDEDEIEEEEELDPKPDAKPVPEPEATPKPEDDPAVDPKDDQAEIADKAPLAPGRDDGESPVNKPVPTPLIRGELPADFKEQVTALDAREDALVDKFEEGDITTREYNAELRIINKARGELDWLERKSELSQETTKGQIDRDWFGEVDVFLKEHPEIMLNTTRTNAYDAIVKEVTKATMDDGRMPGRADLLKAHARWAEDLGIKVAAPDLKKQKGPKNIPPTLGALPAADITETDDGKYAHLDRLADSDPIAYEREISKMSEADFNAYSQSS